MRRQVTLLKSIAFMSMAVISSCRSTGSLQPETSPDASSAIAPRFSIVYVIHGDAGYAYHDTSGNRYRADREALKRAIEVAERNREAEVFIFHQKPRRRFLRLFWHLSDGEFRYYRNGRLRVAESYTRNEGSTRFAPEVELFRKFRADAERRTASIFLYFGHEIPEFGGKGYDASYSDETFTVDDLAAGLAGLTQESSKFDLVILSTCYNGTPHTVGTLAPYSRYIVASPGNLHLSYFDDKPLQQLALTPEGGDVRALAKTFAVHSFDQLTEELQTEISVAVYDVERVQDYVHPAESRYAAEMDALSLKDWTTIEHYDCSESDEYILPGMSKGVDVLYRAARFGRNKHKDRHSGWGCVRPSD